MTRLLPALAAAALVAAACASDRATDADPGAPLAFFLAANAEELAGYEEMVAAFEEETGLAVAMTPFAQRSDLLTKLTTAISGGAPPDVFLVNWRTYGQFAAAGAVEPVDAYLAASTTLSADDFTPTPFAAFAYDGETLSCMPQNASSLVVYFNRDLFAEARVPEPEEGWTWAEFVAAAEALTAGGRFGVGVEPELIKVAPFVWQRGGELVDDPARPTRLTLAEGAAREALDWFLDLSLVHGVVPPDAEEQAEDMLTRFLRGGLGMYLSSRVDVPTLRTIDGFAWDVAPLPAPGEGAEATTILHSDAYCIAAASPRKADAWRLIEFATSERGQRVLARSGRTVPSRLDVAGSPDFLRPDESPANAEVYLRNLERMRVSPTIGSWPQVEQRGDAVLADLFYGRVPREEGIRRLHEATDPLFEQVPS